MRTTVTEPLPAEVGQLGNFQARMLRAFQAAVDDWDEVCSALGGWEAEHLAGDNPGRASEQHRRWVMELLAWGHCVQQAAQQPAFPDRALARRIDLRVQHLEDKLALWHGDLAPDEAERILGQAFA